MLYFLLICSVVMLSLYMCLTNAFSKRIMRNNADFFLFNTILSVVASFLFLAAAGGLKRVSWYTVLLGILFAAITLTGQFASLKAFNCGPMSYTVLFNSCGMLIPAVAGALFWHESVSWLQAAGVAVLVIGFGIGTNFKKYQNVSLRWLCFALLLFFCAGMTGVLQKIHQTSPYQEERFSLLLIAFALMGLASFCCFLKERSTDKGKRRVPFKAAVLFPCLLAGVCLGFVNAANLYLAGKLPSVLFFPLVNGGSTILCGVLSLAVMKERLNRTQLISFVIGSLGVIFLGLG